MKKTLSIALVAAMTLSAIGMTAFAGVDYNAGKKDATLEELTATVKIENTDDIDQMDANGDDTITAKEALEWNYKALNTPTKTFKAWSKTSSAEEVTAGEVDSKKLGEDYKLATPGQVKAFREGKGTKIEETFGALYTVTTDDKAIKDNMKAINEGDDTTLEDKLAELDKKYNADGNNAYNDKTKKDVKGKVSIKRYTKDETKQAKSEMDDFFRHAVKVAGVSDDDGKKTWVYDINMANGSLYNGKTQRVTIELDGVDSKADLNKFDVKVYHIEGWCSAKKVKNVYTSGNKVYFWVDSFSPYVVTLGDGVASTGAADASNPSTGDFSAVPVALLAAAALGATGFVAYKKRKAE